MASKPQQRRGKGDKTAAQLADKQEHSVEIGIQKAKDAVNQSIATVNAMHIQWRNHLMRLGFMVVLIAMHQWQAPITSCLHDIKSYNRALDANDNLRLSGKQAIYYVTYGTFCEMLGFIMAVLLALFLRQLYNTAAVTLIAPSGAIQKESFVTNKLYMVATGLVPPLINMFYHIHQSTANTEFPSCLDHSSIKAMGGNVAFKRYTEDHPVVRGLPVVVIFHVVATCCCWFMDMQQSQQNVNLLGLEKLRKELAITRTEQATKKTT